MKFEMTIKSLVFRHIDGEAVNISVDSAMTVLTKAEKKKKVETRQVRFFASMVSPKIHWTKPHREETDDIVIGLAGSIAQDDNVDEKVLCSVFVSIQTIPPST